MRKRVFPLVITVFAVFSMTIGAWAGNVDTYGIGAKATALGGGGQRLRGRSLRRVLQPRGIGP